MQAFGLQIYMELQMASLQAEKKILQMQTLLCELNLRDIPVGIVTQSPSLVRCDGAALYYGRKCWLLGVTPTEAQVKDMVEWLLNSHGNPSGFSTDCLADAGYPGAAFLCNRVRALAAARITSSDFLLWFRSQAEMEIKWAGAKHHPNFEDDGSKMHPRSSFNAFIEIVKNRSLPWPDVEINAVHSLQLMNDIIHEDSNEVVESILARGQQGDEVTNAEVKLLKFGKYEPSSAVYLSVNACTSRDYKNDVIGVCFIGHDVTSEKTAMEKFAQLQGDYKAIVETPNPLMPPIFASDTNARCSEWNAAMENLTGWNRHAVIGKLLPGEILGSLCQFKGQDMLIEFMVLLYRAIGGRDIQKLAFGFFKRQGKFIEACLTANRRVDKVENAIGCLCFLQTVVTDQQPSIENKKELAYIKQEMQNPLSGICFTHKLLEGSSISDDQKQFLETSDACERQIMSIIENANFGSLEEREIEINIDKFILGNVTNAVITQSLIPSNEKNLQLIHDVPDEIKKLRLHGDQMKLQVALSDFVRRIVDSAPSPNGWVEFKVSQGPKLISEGHEFVQLQFRMAHPGRGLPSAVIKDMFGAKKEWKTHEGIALYLSRKLVNLC